ncbi:glycosyltransferase [Megalodesulfovibrio paquesii]
MLQWLAETVFVLAAAVLVLVVLGNPIVIFVGSLLKTRKEHHARIANDTLPAISILIVGHKPGALLSAKLQSCAALEYPASLLEVVYISDGPDQQALQICNQHRSTQAAGYCLQCRQMSGRLGKNACLNEAVSLAKGTVLVFSDVDALLAPDAVQRLVTHFSDATIGGVGGRRVIAKEGKPLGPVQQWYWKLDAWLKTNESNLGSVTANDGKVYALRKSLFQRLPDAVTDDLFNCLSVIQSGYRFVYESSAVATVPTPSRSDTHELTRRRRIVCRGLRGLWLKRDVLNPMRYGWLAVRLCINKVLRRLLPASVCMIGVSSFVLSFSNRFFLILLCLQTLFFATAALYPLLAPIKKAPSAVIKSAAAAWYICLGLMGTWLGFVDFLQGKRMTIWTPVKTE